jgi:hypothetical protein
MQPVGMERGYRFLKVQRLLIGYTGSKGCEVILRLVKKPRVFRERFEVDELVQNVACCEQVPHIFVYLGLVGKAVFI